MPHPSLILAFDTSGPHVAVALISGDGGALRAEGRALARGQSEVLFPMFADVLSAAGVMWCDITGVAVGIGPGNFTGTRIAVAAARGLALSLGVPAVGVSGFEVMAQVCAAHDTERRLLFSIAAPRGRAYAQLFVSGAPVSAGQLIDPADPPRDLGVVDAVHGHAAEVIGAVLGVPGQSMPPPDTPDQIAQIAIQIAGIAACKWRAGAAMPSPAPMYLRGADAAPSSDPPVTVLA
ncbi:tRNA (adenosine(37)-N6)-threonylcarbamoyltransferase complex dimerization subunit type 1 TsaB [Roseicitreum antarcticum]|uniref:tRNA threonylcarbamoyl adenosine modification protein YeaZ n=1 Tax=Roseicitreum antarcticum TaxID=564137 RepID=A0A1H2XBD6_9RHOB|nr:tRNA (adenosine(37)-N6)-threonylcarbamoyltransferase complex dimerization subunit type 1 TsaB [Roseicitreum antarcticum]SDW90127.1 tRNA threonylcarbamoyl adenosine modification protein YeaZ [Roseicitreum antarcticum]